MKALRLIIRIPLTIILIVGIPIVWLFAFAFDGWDSANYMAKDFAKELFEWNA